MWRVYRRTREDEEYTHYKPVDVVYLDFQKAFDKVPYQRLLLKLKALGIGNKVVNWIKKSDLHTEDRE